MELKDVNLLTTLDPSVLLVSCLKHTVLDHVEAIPVSSSKKIMVNLTLWARIKKAGYLTTLYLNFRNKKDINNTTISSQQR